MSVTDLSNSDPANADASSGVFVGLLPITTDWSKLDLPHCTLVYAGTTADLKPSDFNELAKDASMLAALSQPIQVKVQGVETFGPQQDASVLKLQPTVELWAMRRALESWNASQFPFVPHATIGPVGTPIDVVPSYLAFDRIIVGWGEENLVFSMRGPRY